MYFSLAGWLITFERFPIVSKFPSIRTNESFSNNGSQKGNKNMRGCAQIFTSSFSYEGCWRLISFVFCSMTRWVHMAEMSMWWRLWRKEMHKAIDWWVFERWRRRRKLEEKSWRRKTTQEVNASSSFYCWFDREANCLVRNYSDSLY